MRGRKPRGEARRSFASARECLVKSRQELRAQNPYCPRGKWRNAVGPATGPRNNARAFGAKEDRPNSAHDILDCPVD
jgi:hypothetical protein